MPRINTIRLYDENLSFKTHINPSDAESGLASGKYEEAYEMRGKNPHLIGVKERSRQSIYSNLQGVDSSLTKWDSQRNAGLMGPSVTARLTEKRRVERQERLLRTRGVRVPLEDSIELAQAKVALWPEIGDDKATRVGAKATVEAWA